MEYSNKRVLLINVTCGFGSTGRIVNGIYDELTARGCECMIAYGREDATEGYNAYRIGSEFDVRLHGALSRISDRHCFYSSSATRRLLDKIDEFQPDIVHLHNLHGYYLNVQILFDYLRETGVTVIWTLHDCWPFTGHCTHFEFVGCNKWLTGCDRCEQLREYPKSFLADASAQNYEEKKHLFTDMPDMTLVTPSFWLKGKVEQSFMSQYPVKVVPNGIDIEQFQPTDSDLRKKYGLKNKFVVLAAAYPWRERKGFDEFIKLSRILSDRYQIVMVGLKEKQMKKLPKNIIALPRTNTIQGMAAWYTAADAYVNLTLEDTFPTTNIEALACGTPVVTYKAGGSPECVIEGKCGYVVPRSSIEGVAAALDKIRTGEDMYDNCLDRAWEYSKEKRYGQYIDDVYEEILY